jgi:energy-converting hydrogenase Eha subunit C
LASLERQTNFQERRSRKDRRKTSRPVIRSLYRGGKREIIRRREERNIIFWADRYSQTLFGAIVLILFFSVLDGLLTLFLIDHGATELNPVMAYYLDVGPYAFFSVKYLLTSVAVVILLLCQNSFLRTIRIHTRSLFYVIVAAFMSVVAWELFLIFHVIT